MQATPPLPPPPPPPPQPGAEYFSWDYRLALICLACAFYAAVFLLCHILSAVLSRTYKSLLTREKVFWNLAATRAAFGIQSTVAGLRALTGGSVLNTDRVTGQEDWSWFNILTATGFFVFENLSFHTSNVIFMSFDVKLATHHFFALLGYAGLVVCDSVGHYMPMVVLLMEMSTPFTCVSWVLLKAGLSRTRFWRANQWLMIHAFHCRMVITYYIWWFIWNHWKEMSKHVALPLCVIFFTGLALLTFIINPIWTHKKTMQLLNPVDWNCIGTPTMANGTEKGQSVASVKPHTS
ncbi:protein CLN8 [Brachionichthys hirsutus]|uniref:protein CLN8 n=1 Tax=Brachionichthys hirsutus TaxID=412623 RepID=UPI00360446A5